MKLALDRSITFWSGILVMGFIGWGWWDSCSHLSYLHVNKFAAGSVASGLFFERYGVIPPGQDFDRIELNAIGFWTPRPAQIPHFLRGTENAAPFGYLPKPETRSFREEVQAILDFQGSGARFAFIPYWMILICFMLPWSGLLLWRARRRRKATGYAESFLDGAQRKSS